MQELKEETGIVIKDEELVDMTEVVYGAHAPATSSAAATTGTGAAATATAPGSAAPASDSAAQTDSASETAALRGMRGMYPSVGGCDEFLRLLYWSKEVDRAELASLQGRATGNIEEGEVITLELVRYEDAWRIAPDSKTLCSMFLYERLLAEGKLK